MRIGGPVTSIEPCMSRIAVSGVRLRTSGSKGALESYSEVRMGVCRRCLRTSASGFEVPIQIVRQGPYRNFKSKTALEPYTCQCSFDSDARTRGCREMMRTSESEHWPGIAFPPRGYQVRTPIGGFKS